MTDLSGPGKVGKLESRHRTKALRKARLGVAEAKNALMNAPWALGIDWLNPSAYY